MRVLKKLLAIVYLAAAICALGWFGGMVFTTYSARLTLLLRHEYAARIAVLASIGITALGVLITVLRLLMSRPEPKGLKLEGGQQVEVALAAVESCARATAAAEDDMLVERVMGRIQGTGAARVRLVIELAYLGDEDLKSVGNRVGANIERACNGLLGAEAVSVRIKFLPTKTKTLTKEVSGERE